MDFDKIVRFLTGDLNVKESDELLKQIESNSDYKEKFKQIEIIWKKSFGLKDFENINNDTDWEHVRSKLKPKLQIHSKRLPVSGFILRIAMVLILASGLVFSLYKISSVLPKAKPVNFSSGTIIRKIALPDGSNLTLNKNSDISYNKHFNKNNRELFLRGEAYFNVAKNSGLPFVIRVHNSTIQAIGTSFNIKEDTSSVKVMVVSGKVCFYETKNRKNHVELIKNETASFKYTTKKIIYGQNNDLNFLAWKTGKFEFFKTPTIDVLTTIAGYFNKKLIINIPVSDSITGIFENQPLEEILKEIELTSSIKIENIQDFIIVRK